MSNHNLSFLPFPAMLSFAIQVSNLNSTYDLICNEELAMLMVQA